MLSTSLYQIDKQLPTPAYLQLKEKIAKAISQGDLPAGTALPSERELAEIIGISRMTVRRAFEELVRDELLEQRQGSGTYVLGRRVEQTIDRVLGFTDEARNLGFRAGTVVLELARLSANQDLAKKLDIAEGETLLKLRRLRTADDIPLALQTAYLAPQYVNLSQAVLQEKQSLYKTLESQFGIRPQGARQTVSARLPSKEESRLLEISRETPILAIERITYDCSAQAFELVQSAYRGDMYRMVLDLRAP